MSFILYNDDCLNALKRLEDNSIDSIVTDPPYGLSFMGKKWDYDVPSQKVWAECLRVLKPGGHLLAFAGTRTQHRMAVRIEDAGFEIRDMIAWVYGSGFPKSLDVSKAIDKAAGEEREIIGSGAYAARRPRPTADTNIEGAEYGFGAGHNITAPATEAARQWQGWGTALKPALEPITVARKPLGSTVAECVLAHGTGALNIDGCRVAGEPVPVFDTVGGRKFEQTHTQPDRRTQQVGTSTAGRWPANLIHDGSDEVLAGFPQTISGGGDKRGGCEFFMGGDKRTEPTGHKVDKGSAARFFYCAKASKKDRDEGLEGFEQRAAFDNPNGNMGGNMGSKSGPRANIHPTVKPTDLMRYLCRLVTPPGGVVLDPFMGSGSTGKAAILEGFQFVGIEREAEYCEIAKARIESAISQLSEKQETNQLNLDLT
jgi:DNA modification methylase